ncbi:MAG: ABC transporter ATP-binding protein [Phaeodactylibacter sp.]|nr:ABC transporter ATP-binding protein [Phaeodactylibacter sp.]MCB9054154.1 ABC transporter ATP-binding protein [Lewinellaceae bacterium]
MFLTLENISKHYSSAGAGDRAVISHLSLQVEAGESIAIVGPSGSGKTTLLNLIGTLDTPDEGRVLYKGEDVTSYSGQRLAAFRNREIGFVFQQHHLLPQCTLLENILIPTIPIQDARLKDECIQRGQELLKRVGIWEQRHQKPGELSGGECQRAAVVRALANGPGLLLADEPTGALDQKNSGLLAELLFGLNRTDKVTLILVTHDLRLAARAGRVFLLENGRLMKRPMTP